MKSRQYDFTKGHPGKQMVLFSLPVMLTNVLQVSYQFIDSLWVGNLIGADALGAVAVSSTVLFTILSFMIGMNNTVLTILSQQKGKQDYASLKRYLNAFVVIFSSLSVLIGIAGVILADPLLNLLGTPEALMAKARSYFQINVLATFLLFGYNFIGTVMRALGDSRTPLRFVFIAVLLNTVLDPFMIAGLDLGIEGAAYATVISQGLAFLLGVIYMIRRRLAPFSIPRLPSRQDTFLIFKLGIPAGLQMSVISAGSAAIMSVVTSFGASVVAGFSAAQRLDSLIMLPAMALGTTVNSMAGQNIGIQKWERVYRIARFGVLYNLAIMLAIALIVFVLAEPAIRLFIDEPDAVELGTRYLRIIAFLYPFLGINFILNGIVRAAGAMYSVLVLNLISFWVLRYPLTFLFSSIYGSDGIALGMGLSLVISSLVAYLYFRYGKWNEIKLFEADGSETEKQKENDAGS